MESVFEYTDYRKFLSDFYKEKKSSNKNYSHRFIARHVGFKSGGHFSLIISGKTNISISYIERLTDFLKLKKKEAIYFQNMVLFNQAKSHDEKKRCFEKMISSKEARVRTLNAERYEFYDKWYYSAVREVLSFYPFRGDYDGLAQMLSPQISASEAKHAIALLERLDLVRREVDGRYTVTDALISTGYDAQSLCINNFVLNALELSKNSMDRFDRNERNFSWVSLSVSPEGYGKIIDEIRECRRRIMTMAANDQHPDRAYLFNFQVFPLSKQYRDNKGDGGKP
ncbi:MAG: TIGR02147 family protein [Chitinispirillaceae bacterium]|jgi:uncharacterized protein (TIGR02147 family)